MSIFIIFSENIKITFDDINNIIKDDSAFVYELKMAYPCCDSEEGEKAVMNGTNTKMNVTFNMQFKYPITDKVEYSELRIVDSNKYLFIYTVNRALYCYSPILGTLYNLLFF